MKWYSSYLEILKTSSQINEVEAGQIYVLAFKALVNYGLAEKRDGRLVIEADGLVYGLADESVLELNTLVVPEQEASVDSVVGNSREFSLEEEDDDVVELEVGESESSDPQRGIELEEVTVPSFSDFVVGDEADDELVENVSDSVDVVDEEDEQGGVFEESVDVEDAEKEVLLDQLSSEIADRIDSAGVDNYSDEDLVERYDLGNPFDAAPSDDVFANPFEDEVDPLPFVSEEVNPFDGEDEENAAASPFEEEVEEGGSSILGSVPDGLFGDVDTEEDEQALEESFNGLADAASEMELELSPEDLPAPELPLSLNAKDFTLSVHAITSKDLSEQAAFIVAPLRLDVPRSTAVVQAKINGGTYISTTDQNGYLEFETDDYRYAVDCKMVEGKFYSEVTIKGEDMSKFNVRHQQFGDGGHIVLLDEDEGIYVHIIPTSFKPNEYGYADFLFCVDTGDGDYYVDSNHGEKSAMVDINDEDYEILAKWQDKVLYAMIDVVE